jgi:outer membrane lipopolysaccharide assembly protein LptE/RlpB
MRVFFLLSTCLLVLSGCGYSSAFRAPSGVRTVAVPTFNNATFPLRRELEYELTSAVRREILSRTNLKLVDSRDADLVIHGTIREFREPVVAEGPRDQVIESTLVMSVSVIVEDYAGGKRWQENVTKDEPFSVQLGETLEQARSRAITNLAERILLVVESWEE